MPILIWAVATTDLGSLWEQLIWYPVIGQRQFRGFPGPEAQYGSAAILLEIPLLVVPRVLIAAAAASIALAAVRRDLSVATRLLLPLTIFAALCQLQTQGRADVEHLAQAATPAILLMAYWYRHAPMGLPRFAVLASVAIPCLLVGSLGLRLLGQTAVPTQDADIVAASAWIQEATDRDEPIYVGLTSHRYTVVNPLLLYYLADRRAAVRDAMFNPGVTNTSWGQARMIDDLMRSGVDYLILDREMADLRESTNDSQLPGSMTLDAFIEAGYHPVCATWAASSSRPATVSRARCRPARRCLPDRRSALSPEDRPAGILRDRRPTRRDEACLHRPSPGSSATMVTPHRSRIDYQSPEPVRTAS